MSKNLINTSKEFFTCSFLKNDFEIKQKFKVSQKFYSPIDQFKLTPGTITYYCEWFPKDIYSDRPFVIIPIKDSPNLLKHTLDNFEKNNFFDYVNIIIVDDRSIENLQNITKNYPVSFMKTHNEFGFNFSMLNNIGALVANYYDGKTLVMWNSDLWLDKVEHFVKLIQLHNQENSTISGSKLLYPIESLHDSHSPNIENHFPNKLDGSYKGTVQFGGSRWIPANVTIQNKKTGTFLPYHYKRFSNKNDPFVNSNYATDFVTGALQVINLDWFIKSGGLNPSLPKNFQDTDICLRAVEGGKKVMYFGKDIHFYHDESYTFYNKGNKKGKGIQTDQALFTNIWNDKLTSIIF